MPIEVLWAVLGLAVPTLLLLAYGVMVGGRTASAWAGFGTVILIVLMVVIVIQGVFAQ